VIAVSLVDILPLGKVLLTAAAVEIGVHFLPLRTIARLAGVSLATDGSPPAARAPTLTEAERRALRWARAVMRRWPFGSGACLRRSLVIGRVVRRLRPTLRIGVARHGGVISAHAWLEVPGAVNIGGGDHQAFDL
jgi:hypothetical protein